MSQSEKSQSEREESNLEELAPQLQVEIQKIIEYISKMRFESIITKILIAPVDGRMSRTGRRDLTCGPDETRVCKVREGIRYCFCVSKTNN